MHKTIILNEIRMTCFFFGVRIWCVCVWLNFGISLRDNQRIRELHKFAQRRHHSPDFRIGEERIIESFRSTIICFTYYSPRENNIMVEPVCVHSIAGSRILLAFSAIPLRSFNRFRMALMYLGCNGNGSIRAEAHMKQCQQRENGFNFHGSIFILFHFFAFFTVIV